MTRANARELAVHLIYAQEFTGEAPAEVISLRLDAAYYAGLAEVHDIYAERPSKVQIAYLNTVVTGVVSRCEELNTTIQTFTIDWDVHRISKLTRAIMQLAIFEILYMDDVPTGVAISEAVRIAKLYDGEDTGAFVNGILGAFARSLPSGE